MKYCLSVRNTALRSKADQLKIEYKDKDIIYELIKDYPNTEYILHIPKDVEKVNWKEIYEFNELIPLTLALDNIFVRPMGIKFYWAYPITTYYELEGLKNIGVSDILIAPPLSFDLPRVRRNFAGNIRMVPNVGLSEAETHLYETGLYNSFIRPEDVRLYEKYVDVLEFITNSKQQEESLYEIYHTRRQWPGNLNLIITNLNIDIDNRGIPYKFAENRIKCGQRCMRDNTCHSCPSMFHFTTQVDLHKDEIKELIENNRSSLDF